MSRMRVKLAAVALALLGGAAGPGRAAAGDWTPEKVSVSVGAFEVLRGAQRKDVEIGGEVQFAPRRFRLFGLRLPSLVPILGASATETTTLYAYAGVRLDEPLGRGWWLTPSLAAGIYSPGSGKRLGGVVQFRSSIGIARELPNGGRLGLCLYHLSNARIYDVNPGSESLILFYNAPVGSRR